MDKEPSQGGWSFPDVGNWDTLDPDPPPAVHVEFVVDDRSDEALIPFRMGASAFGAPLSQGDRPLAAWIARIARTLDRLAAGELIAYAGIGNRAQVTREVWGHAVVVVRESHRPFDAVPRVREDRYMIIRQAGRVVVNLGPEPFAAPRHQIGLWIEPAPLGRLYDVRLYRPPGARTYKNSEVAAAIATAKEQRPDEDYDGIEKRVRQLLPGVKRQQVHDNLTGNTGRRRGRPRKNPP